jgi:hypothetical protein
MARQRPPNRQFSMTRSVILQTDSSQTKILVTISYDNDGKPVAVFCADFKAGTALHAIVMDACIVLSRCLQHGDTPEELRATMTPGSLLWVVTDAVVEAFPTT